MVAHPHILPCLVPLKSQLKCDFLKDTSWLPSVILIPSPKPGHHSKDFPCFRSYMTTETMFSTFLLPVSPKINRHLLQDRRPSCLTTRATRAPNNVWYKLCAKYFGVELIFYKTIFNDIKVLMMHY